MTDQLDAQTAEASSGVEKGLIPATIGSSGLYADMTLEQFFKTRSGLSIEEAFRQAAFLICVDVLSQDVAKAPMQLRERIRGGTSRVVSPEEHPVAALLAMEPNRIHTWFDYMQMTVSYLAMRSNAYSIVQRTIDGTPTGLIPLVPSRVLDVINRQTGGIFYDVTSSSDHEIALTGFSRARIPEADMIHTRMRMLDGFDGYSTMTAAADTLAVGRAIDDYRETLFSEEGLVRGVFKRDIPGALDEMAYKRLKAQAAALFRRYRKNADPIVLEDGLSYEQMASNASDAELSKQFDQQILSMCRLFRMPPHKIMHINAVKYENLEAMENSYVGDSLTPIAISVEKRHERALLTQRERARFFIQIDREALNISDPKLLVERIQKLVERAVMTRNEARARVGLNPVPGGDTFIIPTNMSVVDTNNNVIVGSMAGAEPPPETAKAAPALKVVGGTQA